MLLSDAVFEVLTNPHLSVDLDSFGSLKKENTFVHLEVTYIILLYPVIFCYVYNSVIYISSLFICDLSL